MISAFKNILSILVIGMHGIIPKVHLSIVTTMSHYDFVVCSQPDIEFNHVQSYVDCIIESPESVLQVDPFSSTPMAAYYYPMLRFAILAGSFPL